MKLIIRKTNTRLSVASGGEAPVVVKKAEAFLFMSGSTPSAQTQRVRLRFIGLLEGSSSDSDPARTPPQVRISEKGDSATGHQGIKHYWLCERCSHLFTLVYEPREGVVLKARWLGLPMARASGKGQ